MSRRCLIVDQSTMVRRVAARIIRDMGFEIMEAPNAQEALDLCVGMLPEVVMLDWKLPDMNGAEFIANLRATAQKNGAAMPTVIFCTAERSVDQIVAALRAGADEYIMKPFDSDVIGSKFALAGLMQPEKISAVA